MLWQSAKPGDGRTLPGGVVPLPGGGSLPNVLQGLPIGAGPLKSDIAVRDTVVVGLLTNTPKALSIVRDTVTRSWLGRSPCTGSTIHTQPVVTFDARQAVPLTLACATASARLRALGKSCGMYVTPASEAASAAFWAVAPSTYQRAMSTPSAASANSTGARTATHTATMPSSRRPRGVTAGRSCPGRFIVIPHRRRWAGART